MAKVRLEWTPNTRRALVRPSARCRERGEVPTLDREAYEHDSESHDRGQQTQHRNRFEKRTDGSRDDSREERRIER